MSRRSRRPSRPVVPAKHPWLAGWRWVRETFGDRCVVRLLAPNGEDGAYAFDPGTAGPASSLLSGRLYASGVPRPSPCLSPSQRRAWAERQVAAWLEVRQKALRVRVLWSVLSVSAAIRIEGRDAVQAAYAPHEGASPRERKRAVAALVRTVRHLSCKDPSFHLGVAEGLASLQVGFDHRVARLLRRIASDRADRWRDDRLLTELQRLGLALSQRVL